MIILYNVFASFLQDFVVCVVNAAPPLKYFVIYNSPATCAFISFDALTMFYVRVTSCFVGRNWKLFLNRWKHVRVDILIAN